MVHAALAALIPLAYTTATNALPVDPPLASRYDNSGRGLARRQRGGPRWTTSARCYTDSISARTLTGAEFVSESMTTDACLDFCYSKGYKYAGTEWSKECYCDSDFRNGGSPVDDGCDMACSGAADETCGGGNRLSVYEYLDDVSPSQPSNPGWSSQGCYTDTVANRALPNQVYVDGGMTADKCTSKCFSLGYPLAGVEYGHECFCADSIGSSGVPAESGCDMQCTGNANEICGGGNRLNVYQYTGASALPSVGDWVLDGDTGCYTDIVSNRALGLRVYVDGAMTVPKCTEKCFSLNYGYAGLEFADECYCSHSIGSSGVPVSDGCTMSCSGDMSTICGGPDRLTIYKYQGTDLTPAPIVLESYNSFASQGCYTDSVHARIMTPISVEGSMTVEKCIDACAASSYTVAGVEFGAECYCTATLPAESLKATDNCNVPCAGDPAHLCGGADRLNVYQHQAPVTSTTSTVSNTETSTLTPEIQTSASTDMSVSTPLPTATSVPEERPLPVNLGCFVYGSQSSAGKLAFNNGPWTYLRGVGASAVGCVSYCGSLGLDITLVANTDCVCISSSRLGDLNTSGGGCDFSCTAAGEESLMCGNGDGMAYSVYQPTTSNGASTTVISTSDIIPMPSPTTI